MSTGRKAAIAVVGLMAIGGIVMVGLAFLSSDKASDWLNAEATRVDDRTWTANESPLVFAERMSRAVKPQSRFVDASGVALRYHHQTVTITNGATEGTSTIYLEQRGHARAYHYGYWGRGGGFTALDGGMSTRTVTGSDGASMTTTRRGADFRGGGPGSGK